MAVYDTFFVMRGPESHRLADMIGVLSDLRTTTKTAARLTHSASEAQPDHFVAAALLDSAIIRYGRCYGDGQRTAFCIPTSWIDELPEDLRQVHRDILDLRNKHIAHSINDWEINTPVVRVRINNETGEASVSAISENRHEVSMPHPESLDKFQRLANAVGDRVEVEMKVERARLLAIASKIPPEELKRLVREDRAVIPGRRKIRNPRGRS